MTRSNIVFGAAAALLAFVAGLEAKPFGHHGFRHGPPPCGLPPFLEELPADAQNKLNEIWKDYKEGDKCYEEQGLTREILDTLPKDVKKNLHKRPPLPPFLRGLPKETLAKFEVILKDKSIPFPEKKDKIDSLAEQLLTGDYLKKFKEFKAKKDKEEQEYKEKEAALTPAAREAYEKLEELSKQKSEILDNLSEDVRFEIFDLWKSKPHRGPRGGPRHH